MTPPAPTAAQRLAAFAIGCRDGGVDAPIAADVANRVLDVLGNCLAGIATSEGDDAPDRAVLRAAQRWGGAAAATVIGGTLRLPEPSAALVNGTFAHLLDFDDTHLPSVLHPSANVVPAALAVAEANGTGAATLTAAIAAGIEITNRLGMASYLPEARNSLFFEKGLHATSICGTIGAAVAAALLLGADADGVTDAIGIAASMGAGIIEANRTGGTVKRVHCGWAAHAGICAASLAREGVTGPPTSLEGRFGFFQAYLDGRFDGAALLDDLGERWELTRTVYKPYPSNHFTHAGIDCALALREQGLEPDDVVSAELGVAAPVVRTIGEPPQEKAAPRSGYHAKFSGPFTVARALLGGGGLGLYLDDFTDVLARDERTLRIARAISVIPDESATEDFPMLFGAQLSVRTRSGATLRHRVRSSRGGPVNPLTDAEVEQKFRLNAGRALPPERVDTLAVAVRDLASGRGGAAAILAAT